MAEKGGKRLAPDRTSARLGPHRSTALLGNRRPTPNSHIHMFSGFATSLAMLATPSLRRCAARSVKHRRLTLRLPSARAFGNCFCVALPLADGKPQVAGRPQSLPHT